MTVNSRMVEVAPFDEHYISGRTDVKVAQDIVNMAWHHFDAGDKSTWPEEGSYAVIVRGVLYAPMRWCLNSVKGAGGASTWWRGVTHWAEMGSLSPDDS